jgi:hypothetical protein
VEQYKNHCNGSGSAWIRIDYGRLDPDPGEQNDPQKRGEKEEIYCFEVIGCSLLRAEGQFMINKT